ncbi:MAG: PD-(D/E)XK nuclease family protein [Desulfuromonadales bacterium]
MDKILYAAAGEGSLILTVNDRLARELSQQYDREQQRLGHAAWLRPDILSLSAWLCRCQLQIPGTLLFLNNAQLQYTWELIVESDAEQSGNYLLQVPQTARRALQAHQLLIRYSVEFDRDEAAEDHRAFLRWRKTWQSRAIERDWHDPVETPWLLSDAINREHIPLPGKIVFAGFDEITPDLLHLCNVMNKYGTSIEYWHPQPCQNVRRQRVAADDPADEVNRCARWIRSLLTKNPEVSIGVVAPRVEVYQSLIEQVFTAELDPNALLAGEETQQVFNLSLGHGLDREGVIHAALRLLRLGMRLDHAEISWLLCTPYIRGSLGEAANRAQMDREIRGLRRFDWSLPRLARTLKGLSAKYALAVPDFVKTIEIIAADLYQSAKRMPGFWAEYFATCLGKVGWPGQRGLSSREYQAVQHFRSSLAELASLDGVSSPVDRSAAVRILIRNITSLEFQPEGVDGPVQVLGELESSGFVFDHLWVLGLHDSALPKPPSPNPFIPLPVQRRYRMKRCDAEREYLFAEQISTRLFSAAPDIVLSWPVQDNGAEQRPSSFIRGIPDGQPLLAESCAPARIIWQERTGLEEIYDCQGPPLSTRKPFTGGTGIIKDQALCPFRAFAHHRLRAEQLDVPDIGIDNMARGSLAHSALELFWGKVVDQDTLLSLDETTLNKLLDEAVNVALGRLEKERRYDLPARQRHIEQQRLISLLLQWLEFERPRSRFRVVASEQSHQVKIGKLVIRTRIDRIDELDDGTCAIIDYKTGRTDPLQWLDDRISEPQLPAYCLGLPREQIGAVMFAVVRGKVKESGFRGLARKDEAWPGAKSRALATRLDEKGWGSLEEVLAHWNSTLPALGDAFARGDASVDPVDPKLACQYCDLTGFCRILERGATSPEGNND